VSNSRPGKTSLHDELQTKLDPPRVACARNLTHTSYGPAPRFSRRPWGAFHGRITAIGSFPAVSPNESLVERWNQLVARFTGQAVRFVWIASEYQPSPRTAASPAFTCMMPEVKQIKAVQEGRAVAINGDANDSQWKPSAPVARSAWTLNHTARPLQKASQTSPVLGSPDFAIQDEGDRGEPGAPIGGCSEASISRL